jgi:hypothetical protein
VAAVTVEVVVVKATMEAIQVYLVMVVDQHFKISGQ